MTIKKLPSQPSTQWHKLNELIDAHNTLEERVEKLKLVNPMVDFIGDAPDDAPFLIPVPFDPFYIPPTKEDELVDNEVDNTKSEVDDTPWAAQELADGTRVVHRRRNGTTEYRAAIPTGDRFDGSLAAIRKGLNNPEYTLALRGCYASIHEGRKELVIRPVDNEVDDTPQEKPSFREALTALKPLIREMHADDVIDAICNLLEEYYGGEQE